MEAAHVCESADGDDHTPAAPTDVPVPEEPNEKEPIPARTPRSAWQVAGVHEPSNDHPPRMTPAEASGRLENAHGSLATV